MLFRDLALWWASAVVLGLIAFPICFSLFKNLPDRGYAFSKALGLLLLSYLLWIAATARILPNSRGSIILILLLLALAALLLFFRQRRQLIAFLSQNRLIIIATEALFLAFFLLCALVRVYNPEIRSTEQPMDFAFLNGILRSPSFSPNDPWLSGHSISYYYFGYLMMATLTKLTAIPSNISYNLALALLFALTATGAFSLVYNLVRAAGRGRGGAKAALGFGLLGILLLLIVGNLEGSLEGLYANGIGSPDFWHWLGIKGLAQPYSSGHWYPTEHWWWWRATRVIDTLANGTSLDYTITEFPFFSFLLGDLHPHLMALPFGLLALALGLNTLESQEWLGLGWLKKNWLQFGLTLLCLGSLGFLNSWDLPTYLLIFLAAMLIQSYLRQGRLTLGSWAKLAGFALALLAGAFLLYTPFYIHFHSQAAGILPVREVGTRPLHYLIIWGLSLFLVTSFILALAVRALKQRAIRWRDSLWIAPLLLIPLVLWAGVELAISLVAADTAQGFWSVLKQFWHLLPLLLLLALALFTLGSMTRGWSGWEGGNTSALFGLVLIGVGLYLTMGCELFYVWDVFGTRMNTVFKLYYQAWVLLALGATFSLYYLGAYWRPAKLTGRVAKSLWWGFLSLLLLASSFYPVAATYSKTDGFAGSPTLDGLDFLARTDPLEREAIEWLNSRVQGSPVIVEAVGGDFTNYGRVSAWTGLPTILGWPGHELQWRGSSRDFQGREGDVARIYLSQDVSEVEALLQKYQVSYVYVGSLERLKYGREALDKFATFMITSFQNEGVTIYRVRPR